MKIRLWFTLIPASLVALIAFQNCAHNADSASANAEATPAVTPTPSPNPNAVAAQQQTVQLNWVSPLDNQQAEYLLQQSVDGVTFTQIQQVDGTLTSTQVSGLATGTTYYFRLQATNAAGASAYTPVVKVAL